MGATTWRSPLSIDGDDSLMQRDEIAEFEESPPSSAERDAMQREIAKRLFRIGTRVSRWNTARGRAPEMGEPADLSLSQLACLYHLRHGVDAPSELARVLLVTPTAVTALVDRLEKRGYVVREHDPQDRRRVRLVVTESGHAASLAAVEAVATSLSLMFSHLNEADVATIDAGMRLLEGALETVIPMREAFDFGAR